MKSAAVCVCYTCHLICYYRSHFLLLHHFVYCNVGLLYVCVMVVVVEASVINNQHLLLLHQCCIHMTLGSTHQPAAAVCLSSRIGARERHRGATGAIWGERTGRGRVFYMDNRIVYLY